MLIAFTLWILPIVNVEFVWLQFFAPLPVFYLLVESGPSRGISTLTGALLITGLTATVVGAVTAFFFGRLREGGRGVIPDRLYGWAVDHVDVVDVWWPDRARPLYPLFHFVGFGKLLQFIHRVPF